LKPRLKNVRKFNPQLAMHNQALYSRQCLVFIYTPAKLYWSGSRFHTTPKFHSPIYLFFNETCHQRAPKL